MGQGQPDFTFEVLIAYHDEEVVVPVVTATPKMAASMAVHTFVADRYEDGFDREAVTPVQVKQVYPVVGRCEDCESWTFRHEVGRRNRRVLCETCK